MKRLSEEFSLIVNSLRDGKSSEKLIAHRQQSDRKLQIVSYNIAFVIEGIT